MNLKYKTVLFDLDGTLLESGPGVIGGVAHALKAMEFEFPEGFDKRRVVGPPLRYSFKNYMGVPESRLDEAITHYREYYNATGIYEAEFYPAIPELLRDLKNAGATVCVATSKYIPQAEIVLKHFGISRFFDYISGSGGTEINSLKREIICKALNWAKTSPGQAVMIGDTLYDAEGAREAGVPFIGVLYGYGTRSEMHEAGGGVFAEDVAGLRSILFEA